MTLLVLGISHRSAPLRVLDALALTQEEADRLAADLVAVRGRRRGDRAGHLQPGRGLRRGHPLPPGGLRRHRPARQGDRRRPRRALVEHSLRPLRRRRHRAPVQRRRRAGLDGRRRGADPRPGPRALRARPGAAARLAASSTPRFQRALRVGKRAHAETDIDRSGVSLVSVALEAAAEVLGDLARPPRAGRRRRLDGRAGLATASAARGVRRRRGGSRTDRVDAPTAWRPTHPGTGRWIDLTRALADPSSAPMSRSSCTGVDRTPSLDARPTVRQRASELGRQPAAIPWSLLDLALPHDIDPAIADAAGRASLIDLVDLSTLPRRPPRSPTSPAPARSSTPRPRRSWPTWPPSRSSPTLHLAAGARRRRPGRRDGAAAAAAGRCGPDARWPRSSGRCAGPWPRCCTTRRCG